MSNERLIGTSSIQRVMGALDLAPPPACPFGEHTGFEVDPGNNTWVCSTCKIEGDTLDLITRTLGVSQRHAQELFREGPATIALAASSTTKGTTTKRFLGSGFDPEDEGHTLLGKVAEFYSDTLKKNDEALDHLEALGLRDDDLIEHFRIGVANRALGYRLPKTNRRTGKILRGRLQDLGVLRSSGHEHLHGCLVVPVRGVDGRVVQLWGYRMSDRHKATERELWLVDFDPVPFNVEATNNHEVIVTTDIFDALSIWKAGLTSVMAIPILDFNLAALLQDTNTKKIILGFPRRDEDDQAAAVLGRDLAARGFEVHRLVFPAGMGAHEFSLTVGDSKEGLRRLHRNTEWLAGTPAQPVSDSTELTTTNTEVDEATHEGEMVLSFDDRRWRIRGLAENKGRGTLKLNVFVSREDVGFFVDRFDLYSSRHRAAFLRQAGAELAVEERSLKRDLGRVLLAAEQAQDELLRQGEDAEPTEVEMTLEEQEEALELLRAPNLLDRIVEDFAKVGLVGERDNLLVGYLVTISRIMPRPLAAVVQSSSAAGKSSLVSAVLGFVPDESQRSFTAMTGQSLFYLGRTSLKHKVLNIAEEEGASRASYSLKLLQSEGHITIASTGKEPGSGRLVSQQYRVEGPVAILMTTTSIEVDEELLNRCLVLTVDESPEQTARIHAHQRHQMTLQGLLGDQGRADIVRTHRNAQRLLRPIHVVLPESASMGFTDLRVRARRDHRKLLGLIEVVALLHQHQRDHHTVTHEGVEVEFIVATEQDIEVAHRLMDAVSGMGLDDLPPGTKKLLEQVEGFVSQQAAKLGVTPPEVRFTRRQIREALQIGNTISKVHLKRLVDTEWVIPHRAPHGSGVVYSLAFSPVQAERSGSSHGLVTPRSGPSRGEVTPRSEGATQAKKSKNGKRGIKGSRKRNRPPSAQNNTQRSDGAKS